MLILWMTVSWSEKEIAISKDSISAKNPKKIEGMDFLVGIRQDIIITTYEALVSTEDMGFFGGGGVWFLWQRGMEDTRYM